MGPASSVKHNDSIESCAGCIAGNARDAAPFTRVARYVGARETQTLTEATRSGSHTVRQLPLYPVRRVKCVSFQVLQVFFQRVRMTIQNTGPQFRDLTLQECEQALARHHVGRIAFCAQDRVDIQPMNYVRDGSWLFGRTSAGAKLATLLNNPWCAFEIDEIRDRFDWLSVVVRGTFSILDAQVGSLHTFQRADMLLRKMAPGTFTKEDPVPHRDVVFGIFVREISGRMARP